MTGEPCGCDEAKRLRQALIMSADEAMYLRERLIRMKQKIAREKRRLRLRLIRARYELLRIRATEKASHGVWSAIPELRDEQTREVTRLRRCAANAHRKAVLAELALLGV